MILISCRHNFTSNQAFSEGLLYRNYQTPNQILEIDENNVLAQAAGKHVLVLVHGFRSPIASVISSYNRLLQGLTDSGLMGGANYALVLGFTWPGFQTPLGFFPAIPWANRSAGYFRTLLDRLGPVARTVDIQTHSLGARVALQALSAGAKPKKVDNVMLTAPAVDNECLEPAKEFNPALANSKRCLVYHSKNDPVLKLAYIVGAQDRALGCRGPQHPKVIEKQCPNVYVVNCSNIVKDHGGYRNAGAFYEHWSRVLSGQALDRFETLRG